LITVFDAESGTRIKEIDSYKEVNGEYLSQSGKHLVLQVGPRLLELYDLDSAAGPARIELLRDLYRWRFGSEDRRLITVDRGGVLGIWETTTGELLCEFEGLDRTDPLGTFSAGSRNFPILRSDGGASVIDAESCRIVWQTKGVTNLDRALLSPDERTVLVASVDNADTYSLASGERIHSLALQGAGLSQAFYDKSGKQLFQVGNNRTAILLDAYNGKVVKTYENVGRAATPGERTLALFRGNRIELCDLVSGERLREIDLPAEASSWTFDESGTSLAVLTKSGQVIMIEIGEGTQRLLASFEQAPTWIHFGGDKNQLIIMEADGHLTLRDVTSGQILSEFPAEWPDKVLLWWVMHADPTGTYIGVLSPDKSLRVYRIDDGTLVSALKTNLGSDNVIQNFSFSATGRTVVGLSMKGDIVLFNTETGKVDTRISLPSGFVPKYPYSITLTDDGEHMMAIDERGRLALFSLNSRSAQIYYTGRPESILASAYSVRAGLLATLAENGSIRVWDVALGEVFEEIAVKDRTSSFDFDRIRFSADNRRLILEGDYAAARVVELPPMGQMAVNQARNLLSKFVADQQSQPGGPNTRILGVFTADEPPRGALVTEITPQTAAVDAGLKIGDLIVEIDGKAITGTNDLTGAIQSAGPVMSIRVSRNGATLDLKAIFD
jgi:WD40 repeat protein